MFLSLYPAARLERIRRLKNDSRDKGLSILPKGFRGDDDEDGLANSALIPSGNRHLLFVLEWDSATFEEHQIEI